MAERGYRQGAQIIAAVEAFRRDTGSLPPSLDVLVPRDGTRDDLGLAGQGLAFFYFPKQGGTYGLVFHDAGWTSNSCGWSSTTAHWACSGAY